MDPILEATDRFGSRPASRHRSEGRDDRWEDVSYARIRELVITVAAAPGDAGLERRESVPEFRPRGHSAIF